MPEEHFPMAGGQTSTELGLISDYFHNLLIQILGGPARYSLHLGEAPGLCAKGAQYTFCSFITFLIF